MVPHSPQIVKLFSSLNDRELPYCVILPEDYETSIKNYPVLYLLHGLFGRYDNWITNTRLIEYAKRHSFVIVCAEGGDNWYTDTLKSKPHFYETYLVKELIPDVERQFAVRSEKNSRAVAGLSMGGYGAFKLAFRRPEMFCLAASMSGAFHAAEIFEAAASKDWEELVPSINSVFGTGVSRVRRENNLFDLAVNFPSEQIDQLPFFYFDCGTDDSFLAANHQLVKVFREKGIFHKFRQLTGGHDWNYWDRRLRRILQLADKTFDL